jgi:CO/xanthine dehydrogenase FAD-binding subunit
MTFTIATTLEQALAALAAGSRPIAGGSDLVVGARHGKFALPEHLVAIDRIESLRGIAAFDGGVTIGALVNHAELETDRRIIASFTALADGAALVGSPATRNVGTIGGNVMNASPAMDTGAPLHVLAATIELQSVRGSRWVSLDELWTGPGRTSAAPDELCTAISLSEPPLPGRIGSAYLR